MAVKAHCPFSWCITFGMKWRNLFFSCATWEFFLRLSNFSQGLAVRRQALTEFTPSAPEVKLSIKNKNTEPLLAFSTAISCSKLCGKADRELAKCRILRTFDNYLIVGTLRSGQNLSKRNTHQLHGCLPQPKTKPSHACNNCFSLKCKS